MANEEYRCEEFFEVIAETYDEPEIATFSSFYLNKTFADFEFVVKNQRFPAHKLVFACRSAYFNKLLREDLSKDEIQLTDVSVEALKEVLRYIYTGSISRCLDVNIIMDILNFAQKYLLNGLATTTTKKIKTQISTTNLETILNRAENEENKSLVKLCHCFIDENVTEILKSKCLNNLSQKAIVGTLNRDSFFVKEMVVYEIAKDWCNGNTDENNLVKNTIRLSLIDEDEIVKTIWPSKLINAEELIVALHDMKLNKSVVNARKGYNWNLATLESNAKLISGRERGQFLKTKQELNEETGSAYHKINDASGIVVDLGKLCWSNNIKMEIVNDLSRYYIAISKDQSKWKKVVDYSKYYCEWSQDLYFEQDVARYIKIVGLNNSVGLEIKNLQVFLKSQIPKTYGAIICPKVTEINFTIYDRSDTYIQLKTKQPYMISRIKLKIPEDTKVRFRTSSVEPFKIKLELYQDGWRTYHFEALVIIWIEIYNVDGKKFSTSDFQCFYEE